MSESDRPNSEVVQPQRRWINILLGGGILASLGSFLYPVVRFVFPAAVAESTSRSVVAAKAGEIKRNTGKIFKFGSKPALLVHTADGEWKAFFATCTHLNCTVQYRDDLRQIWCACHNGTYDLQGRNVSGPPPRPLDVLNVSVQGDEVVVTRGS
jgi:cytochrome b6-f complex iron-sulfur subunit